MGSSDGFAATRQMYIGPSSRNYGRCHQLPAAAGDSACAHVAADTWKTGGHKAQGERVRAGTVERKQRADQLRSKPIGYVHC